MSTRVNATQKKVRYQYSCFKTDSYGKCVTYKVKSQPSLIPQAMQEQRKVAWCLLFAYGIYTVHIL